MWAATNENMSSGIYGQRRPRSAQRSACTNAQADQVFSCPRQNHWILQNVSMESKCLAETLCMCRMMSLRKKAYSNILKILPTKMKIFRLKILIFFHISAQNIDCGYSLEPP